VVTESAILPASEVRARYKRVKPLKDIGIKERGWTLDVLNMVRRLREVGTPRCGVRTPQRDVPTNTFTTSDVYAFARDLETLHPDNRHVKDKIRQQLQVLPPSRCFGATRRDAGLLRHVERGVWRLPSKG